MIYSFLFRFRKKCYEIKKDTKKENNLLDDIFYLENKTENARSSWALSEGTGKLGYGVTDGREKRKIERQVYDR